MPDMYFDEWEKEFHQKSKRRLWVLVAIIVILNLAIWGAAAWGITKMV